MMALGKWLTVWLALGVAGAAQSVIAEERENSHLGIPEASVATSLPPSLADPGALRARLASRGITYGARSINELLGVVSGGDKRGAKYDGRLELHADWDLAKAIAWRGLTFHVNAFQIHGRSISGENVGSLASVSNIEATPATRLFEVWLEQSVLDGKASVRFGQLAADSEFLTSEGGGALLNGTFGWPTIAAANLPDGGPAYPLATPGARLKLTGDDFTVLAGFFNGEVARPCAKDDPQRCNSDGLQFPLGDPLFMMVEAHAKYTLGFAGLVKVGGWRHYGDFESSRFNDAGARLAFSGGPAAILHHNYGLYGIVDQVVYRVPGSETRGASVFGRVAGSPDDRNLIDFYLEGGVTFTGLTAGRPSDVIAVGIGHSSLAGDVRGADRDRNLASGHAAPVRSSETVFEISYAAEVVPGWTIQPDFQYFWRPGGGGVQPDDDPAGEPRPENAAVIGLRSTIKY